MMGNISNISLTPYKSPGLPAPKPEHQIKMDHNPKPQDLYAERLEDPLQESPKIKDHVNKLLEKHEVRSDWDKAVLLFRAVLPSGAEFDPDPIFITPIRSPYRLQKGLSLEEGGLAITYNKDPLAPQRKKHGDLLPDELIGLPPAERIATCLELSNLLVSLLRSAGIKAYIAHVKKDFSHAYVIALIDGITFKLDPVKRLFLRTGGSFDKDRENIAFHYAKEAFYLSKQGKLAKALEAYNTALEFNPKMAKIWYNKGLVLIKCGECGPEQERLIKALEAFNKALKINPDLFEARANKGAVLAKLGKLEEAMEALNAALELKPGSSAAWRLKGKILFNLGRRDEAAEAFKRAKALQ